MVRTSIVALLMLASCSSSPPQPTFKKISAFDFAAAFPAEMTPEQMIEAAKATCASKSVCGVYAWRDPASVAGAIPLLPREQAALTFRYSLNRATGFESALFDCKAVPRPADQCLAK